MSEMRELFNSQVDTDVEKAAVESELTDPGYYEFQISRVNAMVSDLEMFENGDMNPFYKVPVARLNIELFAKAEKANLDFVPLDSKEWFDVKVCPKVVMTKGRDGKDKLATPSKLWGQMVKAARKMGATVTIDNDVLDWFIQHRGVIKISKFEGQDGEPRNFVQAIQAPRE